MKDACKTSDSIVAMKRIPSKRD